MDGKFDNQRQQGQMFNQQGFDQQMQGQQNFGQQNQHGYNQQEYGQQAQFQNQQGFSQQAYSQQGYNQSIQPGGIGEAFSPDDPFAQRNNFEANKVNAPEFVLFLVFGIVQIMLICCLQPWTCLCGILTVVFICKANNDFALNRNVDYGKHLNVAKAASVVGAITAVIGLIASIFKFFGWFFS